MKPNPEMFFGNIFDADRKITTHYLARFADDVIARLSENNTDDIMNSVLLPLQVAITPLHEELGEVDTSLNIQLGKTMTVDSFIDDFSNYMRNNHFAIAVKLGGDKVPAMLEFYPKGKSEYIKLTKTRLPTIMERLKTAAITYDAVLGKDISDALKNFHEQWLTLRGSQLQGKATVSTNRSDRSIARAEVETCLLKTIHHIGGLYPGDVARCLVFFKFHLLYGVTHKKEESETPTDV